MSIKDHLTAKTADYVGYLTVKSHDAITVLWDKEQEVFELDDEETLVISHSSSSKPKLNIKWTGWLTLAEKDHIINLWNDSTKADGRARTFYWNHPSDGNTYVLRFLTDISEIFSNFYSIESVTLKIEGYKA